MAIIYIYIYIVQQGPSTLSLSIYIYNRKNKHCAPGPRFDFLFFGKSTPPAEINVFFIYFD